jgi:hypothetical protein
MTRKLTFIFFSALLCACAGARPRRAGVPGDVTAGPRPDWADGAGAEFPRARFLTGVGIADDQASAMERARGEISRVFSTLVTANSVATASETTTENKGAAATVSSQDVTQTVRSTSQKVLEGVEIVRGWREPSTGRYYSLAVLDRAKALAAMADRMEELDGQAKDLQARLASSPEKLDKVKYALRLRSLLKARDGLAADMRVLAPGQRPDDGFDPAAAAAAAARALGQLDVAVIMPDGAAGVRTAVISALNAAGLDGREAKGPEGADIAVDCSAQFAQLADPDPRSAWKWSRGTASVSLKDVKTGRIFLSFEASAREASSSDGEARARAETSLGKKIAAEIGRGINSYFEGQP